MDAREANAMANRAFDKIMEKRRKNAFHKIVNKQVPTAAKRGRMCTKIPHWVAADSKVKELLIKDGFSIHEHSRNDKGHEIIDYILCW